MAPFSTNPNETYERLYQAAKRARMPYDKEFWLNTAFWAGEQYTEWSSEALTIRKIPRDPGYEHSPRPVANKIMHFVETEHSMVLQTRPTVDVLPSSEDPTDISNANVALAYLTWLTDETVVNFNQQLAIATKFALSGTEGFLKWIWDPKLKRGNIIPVSPLDLYIDPYTKQFYDARYMIHKQFMDIEQVYDIWGVEVKPTKVDTGDPTRLGIMHELGMAPVLQGAEVLELWMKPSRRFPDGQYVVWTGRTQLVAPTSFPYDHKQLPFTQVGSIMRAGNPHYTSAVTHLRSPQMELNKFHAQMIMVRQNFASPKWWIDDDLDLESLPDDSPNQILTGDSKGGTLKPELIQPTTMPPNDQGAWIANEMQDVVGVHEVSQAQVPGRVEAAKAIELLKEADDGRLAELLRTIGTSIAIGFKQQLMLVKQFGDPVLPVSTYSRDGVLEVKRFMTATVNDMMRVRVMMGTGLSRSRAAREDQLMLMWDNGIIQDRAIMSELMDIPVSVVAPDNARDIRLSRNENYAMAAEQAVQANSWDNHPLHIREHDSYRKTSEFMMLSEKAKSMFEFHVQMHHALYIHVLGQQLQEQQLAAGVAAGAGFQQPAAAAPTAPGQAPQAASPVGQQGQQMPGTSAPAPNAMGAQAPPDPYAVKDSPQGQVSYQDRFAQDLQRSPGRSL